MKPNLMCNLTINGNPEGEINKLVTSNITAWEDVDDLSFGVHYWNVTCSDTAGNSNTSITYMFNYTYPDFMVNNSLIFFSTEEPKEGEEVTINVTVHNLGGADANNVIAEFYNGDPDAGGVLIGSRTFNMIKFSTSDINVTWEAVIGSSQIFVIVDPPLATNGSFQEWNETNNKAGRNITVGSWNFFTGNILFGSQFKLADNSSFRVMSWNITDFQTGNIYIANSEAIISWSDLIAIGKTTAGEDSSEDFSEIDKLLDMDGFDDSVYNVFTDDGEIKQTSNLTVFRRVVYDIPMAISINNSNFTTGILWDSSQDTGDNEFDEVDMENLVFVSPINKQAQGSIGIVDYELRVPANLREYNTASPREVFFYVELR